MASYRDHYQEIRGLCAGVAAVAVDRVEQSALREQLSLPFPILCDTERRVVRDWDVFNAEEKGGIAKPAVFVVDRDRILRFAAVDTVVKRVAASEIVRVLQARGDAAPVRRSVVVPRWSSWADALRNVKRG